MQTGRAQAIDKEPGKGNRTVICWNCRRKGHIARFCRDPPAKQQKENSNPSTARASRMRADIEARSDKLAIPTLAIAVTLGKSYRTCASICSTPVECLIDTGAALSVNVWQRVAGYCRVLPHIEIATYRKMDGPDTGWCEW